MNQSWLFCSLKGKQNSLCDSVNKRCVASNTIWNCFHVVQIFVWYRKLRLKTQWIAEHYFRLKMVQANCQRRIQREHNQKQAMRGPYFKILRYCSFVCYVHSLSKDFLRSIIYKGTVPSFSLCAKARVWNGTEFMGQNKISPSRHHA